jgi:hypothetical protein
MKKPVRPPASERTLTRYVVAYARESGVDVARVRRLISFMAIVGALKQATGGDGAVPAFVVKGGVALELRLRDRARATKDLDLILNRDGGGLLESLEEALAGPYEGFTFRRKGEEFRMRNGALRVKIQLSFQGREWGTVEVDLAYREGETDVDRVSGAPLLAAFGIVGPEEVDCLSLRHHVAQKLHAVTRPIPEGRQNDRFRDLVDLLLMRELIEDYAAVGKVCEEVFARRGTHPWPPSIPTPEGWREPFARMASENDLPVLDLDTAVDAITHFVGQIVTSGVG